MFKTRLVMNKNAKIYIGGESGTVGSAIVRKLKSEGYQNLVFTPFPDYDLRIQKQVEDFFDKEKPEYVFLAAAKVGGIKANMNHQGEFLYENLMIQNNVIHQSFLKGVKKLIFLGSSCIYPRLCPQPMKENHLLTGPLEPTNEGYAIGKIAGLKLCEYYRKQYGCNFIAAIPPNLYGPGDNFITDDSHVISALIKKIHHATKNNDSNLVVWGTGKARREFLFNEDLVDGLIFLMNHYDNDNHINIGSGTDISIKELAIMIKKIIGFNGELVWDENKPDGMPKKLMDSSRISDLNWNPKVDLFEGLSKTYQWYLQNKD